MLYFFNDFWKLIMMMWLPVYRALKETVAGRERELIVLRRKLSDSENEMGTVMKVKDATLQENGQLRDDLDKARLENQVLYQTVFMQIHCNK